jgi:hypothetical protein
MRLPATSVAQGSGTRRGARAEHRAYQRLLQTDEQPGSATKCLKHERTLPRAHDDGHRKEAPVGLLLILLLLLLVFGGGAFALTQNALVVIVVVVIVLAMGGFFGRGRMR